MIEFEPDICIYHANCADGFGAAWAVWKRFGDKVRYIPASYGDALPDDIDGKRVLLVDFSYKQPVLRELARRAAKPVWVIDHHATAYDEVVPLIDERVLCGTINDNTRSGAVLTWNDFFYPKPPPALLHYIQDRDLWKFEMAGTKEIHAWLMSHPMNFRIWDGLAAQLEYLAGKNHAYDEGAAILRKQARDMTALITAGTRRMFIGGVIVPVVNAPFVWASDIGHILGQHELFAATYFDTAAGRVFSLRSEKEGGLDVSEIAKSYGGGGHKNAAGFTMPHGWEGDRPVPASGEMP